MAGKKAAATKKPTKAEIERALRELVEKFYESELDVCSDGHALVADAAKLVGVKPPTTEEYWRVELCVRIEYTPNVDVDDIQLELDESIHTEVCDDGVKVCIPNGVGFTVESADVESLYY